MRKFFSFFALYLTLLFGVANSVFGAITINPSTPYTNNFESSISDFTQVGYGTLSQSSTKARDTYALRDKVSQTSVSVIIFPEFSDELGYLSVSFYAARTYSATTSIGYITNISNASTFVSKKTFSCETDMGGPYSYDFSTAGTIPAGARMAIRYSGQSGKSTCYLFIDDVKVTTSKPAVSTCDVPTSLSATPTSNGATVTWTDAAASKWNLRYRTNGTGTWTTVTNRTSKSYTITGLSSGTEYEVQVQAVCSSTLSSDWSSSTTFTTTCPTPTGILCTASITSASFTWTAIAGVSSYQYCVVARNAAVDWSGNLTTNTNSCTVTGLSASTNYDFYVKSICSGGTAAGPFQFTTEAACPSVTGVTLSNKLYNGVTVNWTTSNLTNVDLRYKAGAGAWNISYTDLSGSSQAITGLSVGATYTFEVKPTCSADGWVAANETYTPTYATPGTPTINNITDVTAKAAWTAATGATGYQYIAVASGQPNWASATNTNNLSNNTISGLTAGVTYTLYVRAVYPGNNYSTPVSNTFTTVYMPPTSVTATNVRSNQATVTWLAGGAETQYQYICVEKNASPDWTSATLETFTAGTREVTITGLNPLTDYDFYVRSYYGVGQTSSYVKITFKTPCAEITSLPWLEEFTGLAESSIPECWDNSASTTYPDGGYGSPSAVAWVGHTIGSDQMLRMCNAYAKEGSAIINTPTIVLPATGTYELTFRHAHNANCGNFYVKVSTNGGGSFTTVAPTTGFAATETILSYSTTDPSTFVYDTVSLAAYTGQTIIIQFYATANWGGGHILLDDVSVHRYTNCLTPSAPTVSHILNTTARVNWTAGGTETAWNIQYKKSADAVWTTISNVTTKPYTLTSLDYNTEYDVKVQAACSVGDESYYSDVTTFTTPCTAINVPWTENFESTPLQALATCWNNSASTAQTNAAGIADGINAIWGTHRHEDNNMARMASYYANDNKTAILNTPQIILPANVAQELTFDYANNMKYTGPGDTDVPTSLQLNISIDGGATWTNLASYAQSGVVDYDDPRAFVDIDIDLTAYKGQTIILQFRVDIPYAAGTDGAAFVDNVEIHALTDCKKPRNLHCTDTGVNSATLDWEAGSDETNWVLQYSRDGIIWSEEIAVSSHPYTLTELGPGTFYYARAVAKCSGSETSPYSNIATFTTDCGPLIIDDLPWAYNFDRGTETGSGKIPPCWDTVAYHYTNAYSETTIYPYVHHYDKNHGDTDDYIANSGTQSLVFYGGDTGHEPMIILPYIEEDMHTLAIDFYHKEGNTNSEYPQFTVGYLRDCEDPSTFVAVQTIDRSLTYTSASVSFAGITDDDVHCIAIRWTGGGTYNAWYGWIDDIEVTQDLYIFTNEYGNHRWDQPLNWNKHAVPGIEHSVFIRAAAHVNDGTTGTVRSVVIDRKSGVNSSIEIMPQGRLIIKNTLRQKNDRVRRPVSASNLIIRSDATGNGVLAVGEHDGTNGATVYFYTKARHDATGWVNQFIGSPFNHDDSKDVFVDYYNSYLYQFDPTQTDWVNVRRGTPPEPWVGYNLLRKMEDPFTLEMTGTLVSSDNHQYDLYYASEDYRQQNVVANSWTAPIDIASLSSDGTFVNCEEAIYLFNAGSKKTNIDNGWSTTGTFWRPTADDSNALDGQFIALAVGSAPWTSPTIKVIPPMQSFIVITMATGAKLNINYKDHVYTPTLTNEIADVTAPTRAPKHFASNDKPDILRLDVVGESGQNDRLFLLVREDFSTEFDNGYDGRKMFGVAAAPQLFALSEAGEMSIDCIADAEGTLLGFVPGEDNLYRIFFTYDGQKTLYLNDLQERVSTLIDDDNHYDFTTTEGDEENRFEISEHPLSHITTGVDNTSADNRLSDVKKVLINNQLYIIRGGNIFSATGALVK